MPDSIMVDLDSTVCDTRHRHHMADAIRAGEDLTWTDYSMECAKDLPMDGTIALIRMLFDAKNEQGERKYKIIFASGRSELAMELTKDWLARNRCPYDEIYLRPEGDKSKNEVFKRKIVDMIRAKGDRIVLAIDDWAPVMGTMSKAGIPMLCVNPCYDEEDRELEPASEEAGFSQTRGGRFLL